MNNELLKTMVEDGLSSYQISKKMGCSQTNVRHWLEKYGLKTRLHRGRPRACECGESFPENFYGIKKYICKRCAKENTTKRQIYNKERARKYLGGKCVKCGFNKYQRSLDIHHLDPSKKDPKFRSCRSWKWERLEKELQNCVLLCKNCHAAYHDGEYTDIYAKE
jgi:hypothetical protein